MVRRRGAAERALGFYEESLDAGVVAGCAAERAAGLRNGDEIVVLHGWKSWWGEGTRIVMDVRRPAPGDERKIKMRKGLRAAVNNAFRRDDNDKAGPRTPTPVTYTNLQVTWEPRSKKEVECWGWRRATTAELDGDKKAPPAKPASPQESANEEDPAPPKAKTARPRAETKRPAEEAADATAPPAKKAAGRATRAAARAKEQAVSDNPASAVKVAPKKL